MKRRDSVSPSHNIAPELQTRRAVLLTKTDVRFLLRLMTGDEGTEGMEPHVKALYDRLEAVI